MIGRVLIVSASRICHSHLVFYFTLTYYTLHYVSLSILTVVWALRWDGIA